MGLGVGGVDELAGDEAPGDVLCQFLRFCDGPGHTQASVAEHHFRTVGRHRKPPLHTHGVRHHNDRPIAPQGRHQSKADAGIAGGGLNDDGAGF